MNKWFPKQEQENYGQELIAVLWILFIAGLLTILASIGLYAHFKPDLFNGFSIGLILLATFGILCLVLTLNGIWSSRIGKLQIRDKMIASVIWRGDETILDVGCGRGLILIAAAKKLPCGRAVGVDIWEQNFEYNNTPRMAQQNALIAGVSDRIELQNADVTTLPFPDRMFDKVFSSLMLHHAGDTQKAVQEMARVLKPNGEWILVDIAARKFIPFLEPAGLKMINNQRITRLFLLPIHMILAKKTDF